MIGKIPRQTVVRLVWSVGSFGLIQLMRLANNVILARLLSPPLFGLMLIVNSIKVGVELLSDVGIGQNIITNRKGDTREFLDTAWTMKVIRGVAIALFCFLSAPLFAKFFEQPELGTILPVIALTFLFTGFQSASTALLQKQKSIARLSIFDVVVGFISLCGYIVLALITPTIWALVLGAVVGSGVSLIASYLVIPGLRHRFMIDRESAKQILVFGKWIFLSSIIYFLAMNFDRLYFAKQISLTLLGVYAIARSMSDMLTNLVVRSTNMVLFPTVAAMEGTPAQVRSKLLHARRTMLLLVAIGLACFIAAADLVIGLLYDPRYAGAATILPLLLLGVWLSILSTVNDSVLVGISRPAYPAIGNGAKLLTFIVGVPLAFHFSGLTAAILMLGVGEGVRYVVLWLFSRRAHVAFARDDLALTILFVITILAARELLFAVGLTGGIEDLFPVLRDGLPLR